MKIGKFIYKFFPFWAYSRIRSIYRNIIFYIYRPLDEAELKKIFENQLRIRKGDVVFVHSSSDKLNIRFSPTKILSILLEVVGPEGTLLFPGWQYKNRAEDLVKKGVPIFDVKRSPSALGLVSELARRHKNAIRSLHSTNSIVAIGKFSNYLIKGHGSSIYPCDQNSPFYKMIEFKAKIIGIGVNTEFLSFVHCPEDIMKERFPFKTRTGEVYTVQVIDYDGNLIQQKTLVADIGIQKRDIRSLIKNYISKQIAMEFSIRKNEFFVVESEPFFRELERLALKGITIYS